MKHLLAILAQGKTLSAEQATEAFTAIMTGQASAAQIAALLALVEARGATVDEIVGAAGVLRRHLLPVVPPQGMTVLDTCGTGGTHSRTFNISTTAALVVAAVGRPRGVGVAKHGNRSVTSASGSSQLLESLGVKFPVTPEVLSRCLDETGFCFCFAPAHHPAMKHAAPVRADLGFRTLFNLLGPLANPAGATRQVMGVFDAKLTEPIAQVLQRLGSEAAMVVHGRLSPNADGVGLGEVSTLGPTRITRLHQGRLTTFNLDPATLGLPLATPQALMVDSPQASAALVREVLAGKPGPARDIVCLNAAAALLVADLAEDWKEGLSLAAAALDSGAARDVLQTVVRLTNQPA